VVMAAPTTELLQGVVRMCGRSGRSPLESGRPEFGSGLRHRETGWTGASPIDELRAISVILTPRRIELTSGRQF
jgi:hypothetical protein